MPFSCLLLIDRVLRPRQSRPTQNVFKSFRQPRHARHARLFFLCSLDVTCDVYRPHCLNFVVVSCLRQIAFGSVAETTVNVMTIVRWNPNKRTTNEDGYLKPRTK